MPIDVEVRNVELERACFDQWLAWWMSHSKGRDVDDEEEALMREAFFAGWTRATSAQKEGWKDDVSPPPLQHDAAINRVISRKR